MSCNCLDRGFARASDKQNQLVHKKHGISEMNAPGVITPSFEHRGPDLQEQRFGNPQPLHA
jgi:hypothetical protein